MFPALKKRFWKTAGIREAEGGFAVTLDDRLLKTPAKATLIVPTRELALAIADEWDAVVDTINPVEMPMTRRANVANDKIVRQHDDVAEMLSGFAASDLLCYRANHPEALVARQAAVWDPALEWAKRELDSPLNVTAGVMHVAQPEASLQNLRRRIFAMPTYQLTAFHDLVTLSGSVVLGFAAICRYADIDEIWACSCVDEAWQDEQWGIDDEAAAAAARKRQDFLDAFRFYELAGQN